MEALRKGLSRHSRYMVESRVLRSWRRHCGEKKGQGALEASNISYVSVFPPPLDSDPTS